MSCRRRMPGVGRGRRGGWSSSIRDEDEEQASLLVKRDGLTLRAKPEEIVYGGDGLPEVGQEVELKLPKELPAISPGFYTVLSDEPYDATGRLVVRVYWNLYPWGAATLVRGITGAAEWRRAAVSAEAGQPSGSLQPLRCGGALPS